MSRPATTRVSVCIPVYNGSEYIAECIQSVLSQTYTNFSLIICDNRSTDNTEEIVRRFRDPRLSYVRNEKNLGLVGNANRCLELADGEYVCIIHHDDIMMKDNLEYKVRLLDEYPEVGFVHSNLVLIDPDGKVIAENIWNKDSRHDYVEEGRERLIKYLTYMPQGGASIFIGSVLARRSCYENLGGFNPELPHCNDSEMWMRMMILYDVACIGEPLVKYRVHPSSTSTTWGDHTSIYNLREHFMATKMFLNNYSDYIPQSNTLRRQIFYSFGERALHLSSSAIVRSDLANGRTFLKEAMRISPWIIKKPLFWKAVVAVISGNGGLRVYQKLRKARQGRTHE